MKSQSVVAPRGLVAHLFGPVEGKRHDAIIFAMSQLLILLQVHLRTSDGTFLCILW